MAFFNDLGKKIGSAAQGAAEKAKDLAEIARLNSEVSSQEKLIAQAYIEIGKKYFEAEKDNPDSPIAEQCGRITGSMLAIEELKVKIAAVKANPAEE
jgi:hypothetical protein